MVKRNTHLSKFAGAYLFPEITKKKLAFQKKHPEAKLISLSIGDTTQAIPPFIAKSLIKAAEDLANTKTYTGYGAPFGMPNLRKRIAEVLYNDQVSDQDIFISDGSKCDISRLQMLFGSDTSIAVQSPAYPAYVDSAVIMGQTKEYQQDLQGYEKVVYMPCSAENDFFPNLSHTPRTDIIFFCSPNNPTGYASSHEQLEELVAFAKKNQSIILYDSAYASFIRDKNLPKSIFEIKGAKELAIETGSFSKIAGFTGVRLGWTIVPKELKFDGGESVQADWKRVQSTVFNAASNLSQKGGLAVLEDEGMKEIQNLTDYYLENAKAFRNFFKELGFNVYSGDHSPYVWIDFRPKKSWEVFDSMLKEAQLVTIPGSGFGHEGEGYIRLSGFCQKEKAQEAIKRLEHMFKTQIAT